MKQVRLPGLTTKDYKVTQAPPRKVPEGMPRLHFLSLVQGARGMGKTNAVLRLCELYDQTRSFDKIVIFSPTYHNDPKYQLFHNLKAEVSVFTDYTDEVFRQVCQGIKAEIEEYKMYQKQKEAYDLFVNWKKPMELFPPELLLELHLTDFQEPQTRFKYGMPTTLLIFDDLVGNKALYTATPKGVMPSFAVIHRHLCTSMIFISQVYKGSVPRQLRNNLSLIFLFRNKSDEMKEEVSKEMSAFVKPDEFIRMWDFATAENKWDFFMVDTDAKDEQYRFRKNFDLLLVPDSTKIFSGDRNGGH